MQTLLPNILVWEIIIMMTVEKKCTEDEDNVQYKYIYKKNSENQMKLPTKP